MNNELPKDQTKRRQQIELLKATVAKHDAKIREQEILLANMRRNQIARCAELRMQELLLLNAERAALKAQLQHG